MPEPMSELSSQYRTAAIQLFAKYPHPGTVKTRLIDELGVSQTTRLYIELLERQLQTVCSMPAGIAIELWGTEEASAEYYHSCQQRWPTIFYRRQIDGDLGQRMSHALNESLHHHGAVLQTGQIARLYRDSIFLMC